MKYANRTTMNLGDFSEIYIYHSEVTVIKIFDKAKAPSIDPLKRT